MRESKDDEIQTNERTTTENIDSTNSELNATHRSVDENTRWCHRCSDVSFRPDANIHKIDHKSLSGNPVAPTNRKGPGRCSTGSTRRFVRRAIVDRVRRSSTRRRATTNNETKSPTKSLQRNKYPNGSSRCSEREDESTISSCTVFSAKLYRQRFRCDPTQRNQLSVRIRPILVSILWQGDGTIRQFNRQIWIEETIACRHVTMVKMILG